MNGLRVNSVLRWKRLRPFRSHPRNTNGYVLLVALMVIFFMMAACAMVAGALRFQTEQVRQQARDLQLTASTDAGIAQALAELSRNPSYRGTGGETPFADGTLVILVDPGRVNHVIVRVTATYAGAGRAVLAEVSMLPVRVTAWQPMPFDPLKPLGVDP